jgi:hypothetical protein
VTYDVYFGTSTSPPLFSNDQLGTTYDPGTLGYDTKYYWKIIATDNHGATTSGSLRDFTTLSTSGPGNGAVSGTIIFSNNGTGIAGVIVNLSKNGSVIASTTMDSNGNYIITDVAPGAYTLTASKLRFWSNSSSVTVTAGETVIVNRAL